MAAGGAGKLRPTHDPRLFHKGPGFDFDLTYGVVGERFLADLLQDKRVEVKTDRKAWHTGNAFVEFRSREGRSGLAVTTAHWWAFIVRGEHDEPLSVTFIPMPRLKAVARAWLKRRGEKKGGDDTTSRGVLVPLPALQR